MQNQLTSADRYRSSKNHSPAHHDKTVVEPEGAAPFYAHNLCIPGSWMKNCLLISNTYTLFWQARVCAECVGSSETRKSVYYGNSWGMSLEIISEMEPRTALIPSYFPIRFA